MKKSGSKIVTLLAAVLLLTAILPVTAWADTLSDEWEEALITTDEYLEKKSTDDAWSAFARARNPEADHTEAYYIDYYESVNVGALDASGDYAKTLLALRAIGRGNSDKAAAIRDKLLNWDSNEAWLTASPYSVPVIIESLSGELDESENAEEKEGLIDSIAPAITARYDYGWGIDVDSTAMAAAALTTVTGCEDQIDDVLDWISGLQDIDGNIEGAWGKAPETTAQAVVALSEYGKIEDTQFIKGGNSAVDGLMAFYDNAKLNDGGGFYGGYDPVMRAQQANYALDAYKRAKSDEDTALYDFSDVSEVYYFSFYGNGVRSTMKPQAAESGDAVKLKANTLTRKGYVFSGWKDSYGNIYSDKEEITADKDMKLYAIWRRAGSGSSADTPKLYLNSYYEDVMGANSYNAVWGDWLLNDEGKYYFFLDGRQAKECWVKAVIPAVSKYGKKAGWFYFDDRGEMLTGWQQIKDTDGAEKWYYLNPHPDPWYGACFLDTITPDDYAVDSTGAWMDPNHVSDEEIAKTVEAASNGSSSSGGSTDNETKKKVNKITVSVSVSGNVISGSDEITLSKNASAYDALKALAKKMGWTISGSSSYVKGIGGEIEKSAGAQSGWIYTVNGTTPNKSAGSYKLKDGDSVDWTFVDSSDY